MNEETKASLNKFLKEREERIKNMTLSEAIDIVSRIYGHSDMRMESDKALQILLDCADKALEQKWILVSERLPEFTADYKVTVGINYDGGGMFPEVRIALYNKVYKCWVVHESDRAIVGDVIAWMPSLPEPYVPDTNVGKIAESEKDK